LSRRRASARADWAASGVKRLRERFALVIAGDFEWHLEWRRGGEAFLRARACASVLQAHASPANDRRGACCGTEMRFRAAAER
jgi:hypothetical protein